MKKFKKVNTYNDVKETISLPTTEPSRGRPARLARVRDSLLVLVVVIILYFFMNDFDCSGPGNSSGGVRVYWCWSGCGNLANTRGWGDLDRLCCSDRLYMCFNLGLRNYQWGKFLILSRNASQQRLRNNKKRGRGGRRLMASQRRVAERKSEK
ncbi:hypothetical protein L218DRAFT_196629 [Marasmius fiardii PR-910]|nr:hypothetical protein L218DRAFT_196629 [Marasmius fiardii PR-910]